jgi:transposase
MRCNTADKFRFYPTAEQRAALAEVFGHTRYVWNWALDLRTPSYSRRDSLRRRQKPHLHRHGEAPHHVKT